MSRAEARPQRPTCGSPLSTACRPTLMLSPGPGLRGEDGKELPALGRPYLLVSRSSVSRVSHSFVLNSISFFPL